jgi:mono/diheme cytochrome c family protein
VKTVLKVVGRALLGVVVVVIGAGSWLAFRKPAQRPAPAEKIEATPERLARGKYLFHHAADCAGCHSEHTLAYGLPVKADRVGVGGFTWDASMGFPGVLAAANITPDPVTGIGNWTDGEILRAIREGVDRDGKALFPIMPYTHLRTMSDDDAKAIVAYLRTLTPIRKQVASKKLPMPLPIVEKFIPQPIEAPVPHPDPTDTVAYGKYLATIGGCYECHTPHTDKGPIPELAFSGGWEMKGPWGRNVTANITPHPETWMGQATKEQFLGRFRATYDPSAEAAPGRNTIMPWIAISGMTDEDLGAIYDYLKTVKPIANEVDPFPDAR